MCTIWATTAEAHVRAARAHDEARGLIRDASGEATPLRGVAPRARAWCVRWREELMTPHVGTLCVPDTVPLDESATGAADG